MRKHPTFSTVTW